MDRFGIELATPGSAVRHASVARRVTDCATRPGFNRLDIVNYKSVCLKLTKTTLLSGKIFLFFFKKKTVLYCLNMKT